MDWRTAKLTVPRQRIVSQIGENQDTQATAYSLEFDFNKIHDPNEETLEELKKDVLRMKTVFEIIEIGSKLFSKKGKKR